MTKIASRSLWIYFILLFLICACKKDNLKPMTLQERIAEAKSWYHQEIKGTVNYLQSTRKDSILIENEPLWDKIQTEVLTDQTLAIVVPVKTNLYDITRRSGELHLVISYNDATRDFKLLNQFKAKSTDTTRLTTLELYHLAFPEEKGSNIKKTKIQTVNGNKLLTLKSQNLSMSKLSGLGNIKDKMLMNTGCTHTFWVEKHWVDGQVVSEEWTYMYSSGCGGNGGAPEEQYPTPSEGSPDPQSQQGGTPINMDTSILNNEKAKCALMKMLRVPQFNYLINPFQGANSTFTLNFNVKTTLTNADARGQTIYYPSNPTVLDINLRRSFVNSEPPLHIAKTLLHEVFHANLLVKVYSAFGTYEINNNWVKKPEYMELNELIDVIENKSAGTNLNNIMHEDMAANINVMTDGLAHFALDNDANVNNFDYYDYLALAYEGLTDTKYYKDNIQFSQIYYVAGANMHMRADSLLAGRVVPMLNTSNVNCNN